jgi:phosphoribosyl 1,2-cyclic phosphate phosphodiesterase
MKVTILGSGAAEGYPALWCTCAHCADARARGGLNLRLRSAALVNDDLLIDCGPDLMQAAARCGLVLASVTSMLVTHSHGDHFDDVNIELRAAGFRNNDLPKLTVYGPASVAAKVSDLGEREDLCVEGREVAPFDRFRAGRYEVHALPAIHGTESPLVYVVAEPDKKLFYAADTGPIDEDTWLALSQHRFDLVISEATRGSIGGRDPYHMALTDVVQMRERIEKEGMLKPGGRFIATHFSHHGNPSHEELSQLLASRGIKPAYDGMKIEL